MQLITPAGTVIEGDATLNALKVAPRWPEARAAYFCSARTGLVAAPGALSNFFVFAWFHPTVYARIQMLKVRGLLTTPPTTAQEWGLQAAIHRRLTSGVVGGVSGTGLRITQAGGFRKWSNYPVSINTEVLAGTNPGAILVAGTGTITVTGGVQDVSEFAGDLAWELAAGVAVPRSRVAFEKDYANGTDSPIILGGSSLGEAILIQNPAAIGAAGVIRVSVDIAWDEVDPSCL